MIPSPCALQLPRADHTTMRGRPPCRQLVYVVQGNNRLATRARTAACRTMCAAQAVHCHGLFCLGWSACCSTGSIDPINETYSSARDELHVLQQWACFTAVGTLGSIYRNIYTKGRHNVSIFWQKGDMQVSTFDIRLVTWLKHVI